MSTLLKKRQTKQAGFRVTKMLFLVVSLFPSFGLGGTCTPSRISRVGLVTAPQREAEVPSAAA